MSRRLDVRNGDVYGKLTVQHEVQPITHGEQTCRQFLCVCACGTSKTIKLSNLRSGNTISCGCYGVEVSRTHGDSLCGGEHNRLYKCWYNMKSRCDDRVDCLLYDGWNTYEQFKVWALSNGYEPNLVLCRTGDVGDYAPDNVRWDTVASNNIEAHAKHYNFVDSTGSIHNITNLNAFCADNNLSSSHMYAVHSGTRKSHKGWKKQTQQKNREK